LINTHSILPGIIFPAYLFHILIHYLGRNFWDLKGDFGTGFFKTVFATEFDLLFVVDNLAAPKPEEPLAGRFGFALPPVTQKLLVEPSLNFNVIRNGRPVSNRLD
jgi:hypothetical protein